MNTVCMHGGSLLFWLMFALALCGCSAMPVNVNTYAIHY